MKKAYKNDKATFKRLFELPILHSLTHFFDVQNKNFFGVVLLPQTKIMRNDFNRILFEFDTRQSCRSVSSFDIYRNEFVFERIPLIN